VKQELLLYVHLGYAYESPQILSHTGYTENTSSHFIHTFKLCPLWYGHGYRTTSH